MDTLKSLKKQIADEIKTRGLSGRLEELQIKYKKEKRALNSVTTKKNWYNINIRNHNH